MDAAFGIGFDLDHTLAIDNRLERIAFLHLLENVLSEGGRIAGTFGDEITNIDDLLTRQRRGDFSIDEAVRLFVSERGLEPTRHHVERFRQSAVESVAELVVPLPGVKPTLDALRARGLRLAILSNGWNPLQVRKAELIGFAGPVLVSSEIGRQKPASEAFEALLEVLGTHPARTIYVGDDPSVDIAGAQALGFRTVWINWEGKHYPPNQQPPEHTISSFADLLEAISVPEGVT